MSHYEKCIAKKSRARGMLELTALTTCPRRTKEVERLQATLCQATSACIQNLSYGLPDLLRATRPDASASPWVTHRGKPSSALDLSWDRVVVPILFAKSIGVPSNPVPP